MLATAPHSTSDRFNLSEELISTGSSKKNGTASGKEFNLTPKEIEKKLNFIEDRLIEDSRNISFDSLYFEVKNLLNSFSELSTGSKLKLLGILQSSFSKLIQSLRSAFSATKSNGFESSDWKVSCEMYGILLFQAVNSAESVTNANPSSRGTKAVVSASTFDWTHIRIALLENMKIFAACPLGRIFDSSTERESITSCLVKASHRIWENVEGVKSLNTRKGVIDVLTECTRSQGYPDSLKTIILQDLIYYEHLSEPIAELLKSLYSAEDSTCSQVCEEVLKTIGSHRFSSQESTTSTKIAAVFFAKFASISPKEALHTLTLFIDQLDSEAYTVRMSMVEVIGVLIYYLMNQDDRSESIKAQTKSLFIALEERFHDVNSFVRSKTLQVCCDLAKSSSIPINKRPRLLQLTSERVMDKSSNVRRKAIQLLGDFLKTHPFGVDGGELNLEFFNIRLTEIDRLINELNEYNANKMQIDQEQGEDHEANEEDQEVTSRTAAVQIGTLIAQKQYYSDAIKFVTLLNQIIPNICLLLSSTTKTEVFDVMEFLVDAHIYKIESANTGIRKMLHLIWEKELSSEDGTKQSIREHLIENYRKIYLYADEQLPPKDRHMLIAKNLISLIDGISIAELASLTELFASFMKKKLISDPVIQQIFSIFTSAEFDKNARRGALILISILSKNRKDIVEKRLEPILRLGLGPLGQSDPLIAQYTLQCLCFDSRIPSDNALFERIHHFIMNICTTPQWFPVINQAIKTVFLLADRPSTLMTRILTEQAAQVLQGNSNNSNDNSIGSSRIVCSKNQLCKLLLMIGQVASCYSDHLDLIERHGKESAQKLEASLNAKGADADLAKVSASAEDDFTELVKGVREEEILFGFGSILTHLAPLVTHVCINNLHFNDDKIQRIATVALTKLMTISSIYCEKNLQLFLTILEKSGDWVVRSNMVIAFGDLAQSYNRIIDQNIDYLFTRLRDDNLTVRRNTLMVLTHLSLCGMIKVKGQIGEIAKCLIDSDDRIRNLGKIFFSEMADRDRDSSGGGTGIYNHIPDILSHLSNDSIEEDSFKLIMKFIFEFIKKERQMENLIEKLCARFRYSDSVRHARDLAYCLNLISFSGDRALKKLIDSLPLYQDKLTDEVVLKSMVEIINRSRKFCKAEVKGLLDEFESKLIKAANGNLQRSSGLAGTADAITTFAALSQSVSTKNTKKATAGKSGKSSNCRRKKVQEEFGESDEEEDFDFEDEYEDEDNNNTKSKGSTTRPLKPASSRKSAISATAKYCSEAESEEEDDRVRVRVAGKSVKNNSNSKTKRTSNYFKNNQKKIINDDGDTDEDMMDIF